MKRSIASSMAAASLVALILLWSAQGSSDVGSWTFTQIDVPGGVSTRALDLNAQSQAALRPLSTVEGRRHAAPPNSPPFFSQPKPVRLVENYGNLRLSFEANDGQSTPQVKFISRGQGYSLFLTDNEAVNAKKMFKD